MAGQVEEWSRGYGQPAVDLSGRMGVVAWRGAAGRDAAGRGVAPCVARTVSDPSTEPPSVLCAMAPSQLIAPVARSERPNTVPGSGTVPARSCAARHGTASVVGGGRYPSTLHSPAPE